MKRSRVFTRPLVLSLQVGIAVLGMVTLIALLLEPHQEGRNVQATLYEIYFTDPFLVLVYTGSVPFYVALFQAFRLLSDVPGHFFTDRTRRRLEIIQYCALLTMAFVALAEIWILLGPEDDKAGGIVMGGAVAVGAFLAALAAARLKKYALRRL